MTPDLQYVLKRYVEIGWVNANDSRANDDGNAKGLRPAYLVLASDMLILPRSEVQVTAKVYWSFRAHKMIVVNDSDRFNLTDLSVNYQSQFLRAQDIPLRKYVALVHGTRQEVQPDPIRWPLNVCAWGSDVSARAIMPEGSNEDPGMAFGIVLLGEAVF